MSGDPWLGPLLMQLLLILIGGWFAAVETAMQHLNDAKLHHDADDGDASAAQLLRVLDAPARWQGTLLTGMTLCWLFSGVLAYRTFAARLSQGLTAAGLSLERGALDTLALVLVTLGFGLLVLALGQLAPRRIGKRQPEKTLTKAMPALRVLSLILWPPAWLLDKIVTAALRLLGMNTADDQDEVTADDIRMMVDMGGENGAIEEAEKEMIENIFEFNDHSAEDVMTHRTDVTSIWIGDEQEAIINTILETGLSRFPVYDEDIDDIVGILNTRDYLLNLRRSQPKPLRALLREAYFVPETVQADVLFRDMQKRKTHMAVVVDEYGGMSGIVTMEDLLEEIVGNIYDEFDPQAETEIAQLNANLWRIAGSASLEDVAEALDIELPLEEDYDTLGGLIFDQFTTIPADGSTPEVDVDGLHIQVELIEEHRVERALVSKLTDPESDPANNKSEQPGKKDDHE